MTDNSSTHSRALSRRLLFLIGITILITLSFSFRSFRALAQAAPAGFGVGSGDGQEVGIKLSAFNQLKAEVATGAYDRACTAAEHDPTKWHTLVNVQAKCHYDHIHGDDPTYVNDIFGEPGAWFNNTGQSVSYPWQTFKAQTMYEPNTQYVANRQMENDLKHEGYIWVVRRGQSCPNGNCVTDFRLQTHAIMGAHDMPVRFHSFSLEARLCLNANNPSSCGIVRYGGWIDMGVLFTTDANDIKCDHSVDANFISLPADTQYFPIDRPDSRDEIRCHPLITNLPSYPSSRPLAEWWGHGGGETRFQLRSYDPIGNVDPSDPAKWHFFCEPTDMNCRYDASIFSVFIGYTLHIHDFADTDGNGRTDYRGYFDRWAEDGDDCTTAGLDCIPFVYDNVPLNFSGNREARYAQTVCGNCARVDHDISPPGKRWITWFYRYAEGNHETPTPETPTPETPTPETPTPETPTPETPTPETPTPEPTDPSSPTVRVDLNTTSTEVGGQVEATLNLFNVTDLYGLQAQCTTNPAVLAGVSHADGAAFSNATGIFVDNGFQAASGAWTIAATRIQPNGPYSENGSAFKLIYQVLGTDPSAVTCNVMAVDVNGNEIPVEVINAQYDGSTPTEPTPETPTPETPTPETPTPETPTPETPTPETPTPEVTPGDLEFSVISGTVQYQNRSSQAGITVQLLSGATSPVTLTTNENGVFSFTDVPVGVYMLEASAPGHLKVNKVVSVDAGGLSIDVGVVALPAGDTDNNGVVDIADAGLIGANFGVSAPPAPVEADLNLDAVVNVRDLVLVGGNFGKIGPVAIP